MKTNKQALAKALAQRHNVPESHAYEMISCVFDTLENELLHGRRVVLRDFGSFKPAAAIKRGSYTSNLTGKPVTAHTMPRINFVASNTLRKKLISTPSKP